MDKTQKSENQSYQMEDLLASLLSGKRTMESFNLQEFPYLIQALKDDRDLKIAHGNIDGSDKINGILFSARQCYNRKKKESAMEMRFASLNERIIEAEDNLEEAKHNYLLDRLALEELHKQQIYELGIRQKHETEQLHKLWNSKKYQRMYNKPSPELRTLQFQESLLQNYDSRQLEQKKAQKQIQYLSKTELNEKSRLMNTQYQEATQNLERKQKSTLNILLQKQREQFDQLKLREADDIRMREQRLKNLINEKEALINLSKSCKSLSEDKKSVPKNNKKDQDNQNSQMQSKNKPCYADFAKLPLPSLSLTLPKRMNPRSPRYLGYKY